MNACFPYCWGDRRGFRKARIVARPERRHQRNRLADQFRGRDEAVRRRCAAGIGVGEHRPPGLAGPRTQPTEPTVPVEPGRAGGYRPWAQLLARTFAVDVLTCSRCQGRLKQLAMVTDPASVGRDLAVTGEPEVLRRSPGPGPPYWKSRVLRRRALGQEDGGTHGVGRTTAPDDRGGRSSAPGRGRDRRVRPPEARSSRSKRSRRDRGVRANRGGRPRVRELPRGSRLINLRPLGRTRPMARRAYKIL